MDEFASVAGRDLSVLGELDWLASGAPISWKNCSKCFPEEAMTLTAATLNGDFQLKNMSQSLRLIHSASTKQNVSSTRTAPPFPHPSKKKVKFKPQTSKKSLGL